MTDTPTPAPSPAPSPKKPSPGRIIFRLFGLLVLLIVVGIVVLYLSRNAIVRAGIIRGGHYATDQDTSLDAADFALAGKLGLTQLKIKNLADKAYREPNLLTMKDCAIDVETGSLFSSTVTVNSIKITGLEITIEQNGMKNNLSDLVEIIKKKSPAAATAGNAPPESPGKKLAVKHLELNNTKVYVRGIVSLQLDIGPIAMEDITNPDGRAVKIADVMVKVLLRVSLQITQQLADDPRVPKELKEGLQNVNNLVNNLKGNLLKGDFAENLKKFDLSNLGNAATQLQGLGKDIQNLGKDGNPLGGLQNLIPGGAKPPTSQPK